MTEKVTKLALASRIIVLLLQFLANLMIPDHKPDVFRTPQPSDASSRATVLERLIAKVFGGLRHWDGEYFMHISEHMYSYENTLAFYPLYPILVRNVSKALNYFGLYIPLRSLNLITAVIINLYFFCIAANILYTLTQRVFNDLNKSWNATLLFCFNPSSIFFSAVYSETLFVLLSFQLMLECLSEINFRRSTFFLAASTICRSNGLVNIGFPVYFYMRAMLINPFRRWKYAIRILLTTLLATLPLTFFYFYAFQQFCSTTFPVNHTEAVIAYAHERNYILAGNHKPEQSPWCNLSLPYPYSYVQSHYWNVGFLRYYEWKQLPNFVLALPVLSFLLFHTYDYLRHFICNLLPHFTLVHLMREYKSLPFILHALFLTIFCTCCVHIQVSTRLLCSATPVIYWFAADYMPKSFAQLQLRSKASLILLWFGGYYLVGTTLFSNNLPWT